MTSGRALYRLAALVRAWVRQAEGEGEVEDGERHPGWEGLRPKGQPTPSGFYPQLPSSHTFWKEVAAESQHQVSR